MCLCVCIHVYRERERGVPRPHQPSVAKCVWVHVRVGVPWLALLCASEERGVPGGVTLRNKTCFVFLAMRHRAPSCATQTQIRGFPEFSAGVKILKTCGCAGGVPEGGGGGGGGAEKSGGGGGRSEEGGGGGGG
jgi:hypothetical protein